MNWIWPILHLKCIKDTFPNKQIIEIKKKPHIDPIFTYWFSEIALKVCRNKQGIKFNCRPLCPIRFPCSIKQQHCKKYRFLLIFTRYVCKSAELFKLLFSMLWQVSQFQSAYHHCKMLCYLQIYLVEQFHKLTNA